MSLTEEQRSAIGWQENLMLTACPGSGKTRTIVAKLIQEVEALRDTPRAVACITYTNSAVQEIESRISAHLQHGDSRHFKVSTIHSFCLTNILRPFAWRLPGFVGTPKILTRDKPEFEQIVRHATGRINYHNITQADLEAFEGLNLNAAGELIGSALSNEVIQRSAPFFWQRCDELGFIDFCNIIYRSYCLLRDFPDIAQSLAARFSWFLVDEFQDTSELQTEILKLIHATTRSKFFVVGDPAQSIFSFTGARPELLQPFAEHIDARTDISLTGNFRSNPQIVSHAERVFPRESPMTSVGEHRVCTEEPRHAHVNSTFEAITDQFLPRLTDLGIELGDASILSRDWASLLQLSRRLRDFGVPVVGPGARPYRKSRLFATLAEQLCGAIAEPQPNTVRQLERALFMALQDARHDSQLEVDSFNCRVAIIRLLREARRLATIGGAVQWLDSMSTRTGEILLELELVDRTQAGLFFASVQEMKSDMQRQNIDMANLTIDDLGLFASPTRALRLSTIHYAKGREYSAVAIMGLREGTVPHFRATDIEDEKRLFYVGLTRAKRVLLYITERDRWRNPPSRFLGEDGVDILNDF
jgi:DNA helicase-2/ATP-dependent DNA helicase PcrA